jgi:hypothetical protein
MNRQVFYAAFGFENEKPILIGFIIIIQFLFAPYNEVTELEVKDLKILTFFCFVLVDFIFDDCIVKTF